MVLCWLRGQVCCKDEGTKVSRVAKPPPFLVDAAHTRQLSVLGDCMQPDTGSDWLEKGKDVLEKERQVDR